MRIKKSIINSLTAIISIIILSVLGFVSTTFLLKYLGLEYNGINSTFTNIVAVLSITELGLGGAITYNLYKPIAENDRKKISAIMHFYKKCYIRIGIIIIFLAIIVSLFVTSFLKDLTIDSNYVRFLFIIFALNTGISYFLSYNRNLFYAYQENYIVSVIDFIFKVIKVIFQILSLIIWKNYAIFLIINLLFTFLSNYTIHLFAKKRYPDVISSKKFENKDVEKNVFEYVKSYALMQLFSISINFSDSLIISSFISVIKSGLYANYYLIFSQITNIVVSFYHNIGASIGNLCAEDNKEKIKTVLVNLEFLSFFIASVTSCCFVFLTTPFIKLWIGEKYILSFSLLAVLVFNYYMNINRQNINYFVSASGLYKKVTFPFFIESLINIIISIILAIKIGLVGVFIGTMISGVISWTLSSKVLYNYHGVSIIKYYLRQVKFIIVTIIYIVIINIILSLYIPSNLILSLIYILLICLVVSIVIGITIIFNDKNTTYLKEILLNNFNKIKNTIRRCLSLKINEL